MKLFHNADNDKVIELLRRSGQNFQFDQEANKAQIFQKISESGGEMPSPTVVHLHVLRYSVLAVCLLLVVSGTFAYASSNSRPGDRLFSLNKLGDQLFLSLPFSPQTKAAYQTNILTERLGDLDHVELQVQTSQINAEVRGLATVKASDDSINTAIKEVSANRDTLQAAGNTAGAAQLSQILTRLVNLAEQHEEKIQILESETTDANIKQSIQQHLEHIHQARNQASDELEK